MIPTVNSNQTASSLIETCSAHSSLTDLDQNVLTIAQSAILFSELPSAIKGVVLSFLPPEAVLKQATISKAFNLAIQTFISSPYNDPYWEFYTRKKLPQSFPEQKMHPQGPWGLFYKDQTIIRNKIMGGGVPAKMNIPQLTSGVWDCIVSCEGWIACSSKKTIYIWDLSGACEPEILPKFKLAATSAIITLEFDGDFLWCEAGEKIYIWNLKKLENSLPHLVIGQVPFANFWLVRIIDNYLFLTIDGVSRFLDLSQIEKYEKKDIDYEETHLIPGVKAEVIDKRGDKIVGWGWPVPVGEKYQLLIFDPKGNVLFRHELNDYAFGIDIYNDKLINFVEKGSEQFEIEIRDFNDGHRYSLQNPFFSLEKNKVNSGTYYYEDKFFFTQSASIKKIIDLKKCESVEFEPQNLDSDAKYEFVHGLNNGIFFFTDTMLDLKNLKYNPINANFIKQNYLRVHWVHSKMIVIFERGVEIFNLKEINEGR